MIKRFTISLNITTESNKETAVVTLAGESGPTAIEFDTLPSAIAGVVAKQLQAMLPDQSKAKAEADKVSELVKKLQAKVAELESEKAAAKVEAKPEAVEVIAQDKPKAHRRSRE